MFLILIFIISNALLFALCGLGLNHVMSSGAQLLGFIPLAIERYVGVKNMLYRLVTCPVCLSGQVAFWAFPFYCIMFLDFSITEIVLLTFLQVFCTVGLAVIISKQII